ncbi:hypothetical protein D5086_013362 [Populus alba]|uniref:Uncharacterized protein n=1 Tax=Populus alba TaxID=43335 RepID=A0ACC4C4S7_POPAL
MEFHLAKSHPHKRITSPSTLIGIAWCSSSRWKEINNRIHGRCHCEEQCVVCSVKAAQCNVAAERMVKSESHILGQYWTFCSWKSQFQTCTSVLLRVLRLPIKQCSSSTTDRSNDGAIPGKSAFTVDVADDKGYG